jgi:hypothetical protein
MGVQRVWQALEVTNKAGLGVRITFNGITVREVWCGKQLEAQGRCCWR